MPRGNGWRRAAHLGREGAIDGNLIDHLAPPDEEEHGQLFDRDVRSEHRRLVGRDAAQLGLEVHRCDALERTVDERRVELEVRVEKRADAPIVPSDLLEELAVAVELGVLAVPEPLPLLRAHLPLLDLTQAHGTESLEVVVDDLVDVLCRHVADSKVDAASAVHLKPKPLLDRRAEQIVLREASLTSACGLRRSLRPLDHVHERRVVFFVETLDGILLTALATARGPVAILAGVGAQRVL
jgi:hypothetical protein